MVAVGDQVGKVPLVLPVQQVGLSKDLSSLRVKYGYGASMSRGLVGGILEDVIGSRVPFLVWCDGLAQVPTPVRLL